MHGAESGFANTERSLAELELLGPLVLSGAGVSQAVQRGRDHQITRRQCLLAHRQHAPPEALGFRRSPHGVTQLGERYKHRRNVRMIWSQRTLECKQLQQQRLGPSEVAAFDMDADEIIEIYGELGLRGFDSLERDRHRALKQRLGLIEGAASHVRRSKVVDSADYDRMIGTQGALAERE
jgi:hypothetical protein